MKTFHAKVNDKDVRISRFILSVAPNMPSSVMYKGFRNKRIKVNGKRVAADYRLNIGDIIELYLNDEFFPNNDNDVNEKKIEKAYEYPKIIFEDENILVMNKNAGMLCHSDNTGDDTLLDSFTYYLKSKGEYNPNNENRFKPALCNRIDRGTEGLVIGAKKYSALRDMNEVIKLDLISKQYLCICKGTPKNGVFTAGLLRNMDTKKVTIRPVAKEGYKEIKTGVNVLKTNGDISLVKITLYTGRTHQIRAHLAFLGYPLIGDRKYGNAGLNKKYGLENQALCSYRLEFKNIDSNNTLSYLSGKRVVLNEPNITRIYEKLCNLK